MQYLRCEVKHGVAVGQVIEVAHEDETAPLRKGGARARLRLVRVGNHLHLDRLAARGTHLRGAQRVEGCSVLRGYSMARGCSMLRGAAWERVQNGKGVQNGSKGVQDGTGVQRGIRGCSVV